jgi:ankyrin repeat protein
MSLKDSAEQMKVDICTHITEELKTQKKLSRLSEALKTIILDKLSEKAKGMFRWVQCQLDVIMTCKRPDSIRKALDDLPAGLYETYDRIIHSIEERGKDDGPIAQRCLLFVTGAFTPLTLDELNEAMMIEVGRPSLNEDLGVADTMDIVAACGSLVTYNENTRVVALSHYSVNEYLISRRPNKIFKSISDMHARICELLIAYVLCDFVDEICVEDDHPTIDYSNSDSDSDFNSDDDSDSDDEPVQVHPLLSYAIQGWKHLGHVSDQDSDVMDALSQLHSEFLRNTKKHHVLATQNSSAFLQPAIDRWLNADVTFPSLLFIPLEHGKPWMVESLVKQRPDLLDVDIAPGWGSPLIFAIAKRPDCLGVLLKLGVDLNKLSSIKSYVYAPWLNDGSYAPISWALVTGSEVAVEFLLSHTKVDIPNNILHTAVTGRGPLSHKSIRKFRQCGADVNFMVNGSTPIHYFLSYFDELIYDKSQVLPVVKALVEPSCNFHLQDRTARTVLHIALDARLQDVIAYLLEQNAGLSATATLLPDMWSWATNETWFPKVQVAALAAHQPCTRIKGKVVDTTKESKLVEFPVAVSADCDNSNLICAVVVSVIVGGEPSSPNFLGANLSCCNQSLQKDTQDTQKDDSPGLELSFSWRSGQRVSSCLLDYHQGDEVIRILQQLTEDKDSTSTSFFLQMLKRFWNSEVFELGVECILDIYQGPLP